MISLYRIVFVSCLCVISVQAEYRCDTYCIDSKLGVGYSYETHTSAPADITNHGVFLAGAWRRWDSQYGFSWEAKAGYTYTHATNTPQSPIAFTQSHIATNSGFIDMLLHFGKNLRTMQNPLFVEILIGANVSLYQAQSQIPNNGLATIGLGISGIQRLSEAFNLEYALSYGYGVYGSYIYLRSQDLWHNVSTLKPSNHEIRAFIGLQHDKKYGIYTCLSAKYQILDSASPARNYVGDLVSYPHSTRLMATLEVGVSLP